MLNRAQNPAPTVRELVALLEQSAAMLRRELAPASHRDGPRLLTVREAAERLAVSPRWLYARARELPFVVRVGRHLRFDPVALDRWVADRGRRARVALLPVVTTAAAVF